MKHLVKKNKNILLGILFIAIIVCTPFMFGNEVREIYYKRNTVKKIIHQ